MEKSVKQYSKYGDQQFWSINETGFYSALHSKRMVMLMEGTVLPLVSFDDEQCQLYVESSGWGNKVREVITVHASKVSNINELQPET